MKNVYPMVFLSFLVSYALVAGGALFQTFAVIPYYQMDISIFRNATFGASSYFPIISPLMSLLWIATVIIGWKKRIPNKMILNFGHILKLVLTIMTYSYFAPFLINNFGNTENVLSDSELLEKLNLWASLDRIRQFIGVLLLIIFTYSYGNVVSASKELKN